MCLCFWSCTPTGGILYTLNVHPDYTTVRSTSQAETLETKGPTGFNPWGAIANFDSRSEI